MNVISDFYLIYYLIFIVCLFIYSEILRREKAHYDSTVSISDLNVLEIAAIDKKDITHKDIGIAIFELASKGYLKLHENENNVKKVYVSLVKRAGDDLSPSEKMIMAYLFGKNQKVDNKKVDIDHAAGFLTRKKIRSQVFKDLKSNGIFRCEYSSGKAMLSAFSEWVCFVIALGFYDFYKGGNGAARLIDSDLMDSYILVLSLIVLYYVLKFWSKRFSVLTAKGKTYKGCILQFKNELLERYRKKEFFDPEEYCKYFGYGIVLGSEAYLIGLHSSEVDQKPIWYETEGAFSADKMVISASVAMKHREDYDVDFPVLDLFVIRMTILFIVLMFVDLILG